MRKLVWALFWCLVLGDWCLIETGVYTCIDSTTKDSCFNTVNFQNNTFFLMSNSEVTVKCNHSKNVTIYTSTMLRKLNYDMVFSMLYFPEIQTKFENISHSTFIFRNGQILSIIDNNQPAKWSQKTEALICSGLSIEICLECLGTSQNCGKCPIGYGLIRNTDSKITCVRCDSENVDWVCGGCNSNYLKDETHCCSSRCASETCVIANTNSTAICTKCIFGYYLSSGECISCETFTHCLSCSQTESKCIKCNSNYFLNADGNCQKCDSTCGNSCDGTSGYCTSCIEGYVKSLSNPSKCINCTTFNSHCSKCLTYDRECIECQTGYYPSSKLCTPCSSTCKTCDTKTGMCTVCIEGYTQFSTSNNNCEDCKLFDSSCTTCSTTTRKCLSCNKGKYPSSVYPYNCLYCSASCGGNCNNQGFCLSCNTNYVFRVTFSSTCEECSSFDSNCITCSPTWERICIECKTGFYPNTSTGLCVKCSDTCSDKCSTTNGTCISCLMGYVLYEVASKTCQPCLDFDSNCITCASNSTRICLKCNDGNFPDQFGKCTRCDTTCGGKCNNMLGYCTGCESGYVLNSTNSTSCIPCKSFDIKCQKCADNGERKCINCENGMYPGNTKMCIPCDETCNSCNASNGVCASCASGYVYNNPPSQRCESCSSFDFHCKTCMSDSSRKCSECNSNYYPKTTGDYKCQTCSPTCGGKCDGVSGQCTGCSMNYVFSNTDKMTCDTCSSFDSNCVTCATNYSRMCTKCTTAKYPDETSHTCIDCSTTCNNKCNTSNGMCEGCQYNFVFTEPKSNVCVSCISFDTNCSLCDTNYSRKCIQCNIGFYPNASGICVHCHNTCQICNPSNGYCSKCINGLIQIDSTSLNCQTCNEFDSFCETCDSNKNGCVSCQDGKYPGSNGKCTLCSDTCNSICNKTNGICMSCKSQYVFDSPKSTKCVSCTTFDQYCAKCPTTFDRKCLQCSSGKYPNPTTCQSCDLTCGGNCDGTTGFCTSCILNYVFDTTSSLRCIPCNAFDPNCAVCSPTFDRKCIQCDRGYYIINGVCVKCDSTCGNYCDTNTGICTNCISGYVFTSTPSTHCEPCSEFDLKCTKCASQGIRKCELCIDKSYANPNAPYNCIKCSESCTNCNGANGECTSCIENEVKNGSNCIKCTDYDNNCRTCSPDSSQKCIFCNQNYYPKTNGDFRCQTCNTTCGGKCEGNTGYCTGCEINYVLTSTKSLYCDNCKTFDINCKTCSHDFSRKCTTCEMGYYPNDNFKCQKCDSSCENKCNTETGYCKSCSNNFVMYNPPSQRCESCSSFDFHCKTCMSDSSRKCSECNSNYYPKTTGDYKCQTCSPTCGGKCDGVSGQCTGCSMNYVFSNTDKMTCDTCSSFDSNCVTCATNYSRMCTKCTTAKYPDETSHTCIDCSTTCNNKCNTSNGMCEGCQYNFVFTEPKSNVCVSCISFDTNCFTCSPDFSRKCIQCNIGFYPNASGICVNCNTIKNCKSCVPTEQQCLECNDPFILSNGKCSLCEDGYFKDSQTTCQKCLNLKPNCKKCSTVRVGIAHCDVCFPPFSPQNGDCVSCKEEEYYDGNNCTLNDKNCMSQLTTTQCLLCDNLHFLSDFKCISLDECNNPTKTSCDCSDVISINSNCEIKSGTCKYLKINKGNTECIMCNDNMQIINSTCLVEKNDNVYIRNNAYFICPSGYYTTDQQNCSKCYSGAQVCVHLNDKLVALKCDNTMSLNYETTKCVVDTKCLFYINGQCVTCSSLTNMEITSGFCQSCKVSHCKKCRGGICFECDENYLLYDSTRCVEKSTLNCARTNRQGCLQCNERYHQNDTKNSENKMMFCSLNLEFKNWCKYYAPSTDLCFECDNSYFLLNYSCQEVNENTYLPIKQFASSNYKYASNFVALKQEELNVTEDEKCELYSNKGCARCKEGYYFNNSSCLQCSNTSIHCYNTTYSLKCPDGSFIDSSYVCKDLGNLKDKCKIALPSGGGCAICKTGFYKVSKDCLPCDSTCETCLSSKECVTCKSDHFKIIEESKLCQPYNNMTDCEEITEDGCEVCSPGFYSNVHRCSLCPESCTLCKSNTLCTWCLDSYVLKDGRCVIYTSIELCEAAANNSCTKCSGWNRPSDDGISCVFQTNYGVVIGVPAAFFVVLFIVIGCVIFSVYLWIQAIQYRTKIRDICIFDMKRSNVNMINLTDIICTNKRVITFDLDGQSMIPVDEETRDIVCIGNRSQRRLKVQFSVVEGCDNYTIRTIPPLITLSKGEACEFEIYITPLCCCNIKDGILVIGLDISKGVQYTEKIQIETQTMSSYKLDYNELIEEQKLGEGSFGIVYLGEYRGNKVAIKKMKEAQVSEEATKEFSKEVMMLNKFRCDYIIHFYGAVFKANRISLVTEYAQFGSLQSIMVNMPTNPIRLKIRIKLMLDAARGMQYLHENNILHRDIKPDNILIVSMDDNVLVNGKLTDFGSSRNINMLMTNMTFTKSVGTPVYMAPEVLKREKYKKEADVYSFGITMYECFMWKEAYPKSIFKFPWMIAEQVINGKRPVFPNCSNDSVLNNTIQEAWKSSPKSRISVECLVSSLQEQLANLN
ncbi:protein serine/threonine kinase, putative [Entamoeba invadens IP1]|uniref:Protein serine/threonine kinase, putative n=1 Tax=Entamoeba invadens IP1 TaxID=370355 RepID=A0A0A1U443_ENTIV|nr:protein serine/threonine kinase, putative [Entamoeba invadens IP1]ELP87473.1 protein serine/threonine kinase, putative [Entamoeba invadens IP1]|eukprot:XP_004254244.1 protein serine/threonine kinase, putative [Entamoeba invadens IP1]